MGVVNPEAHVHCFAQSVPHNDLFNDEFLMKTRRTGFNNLPSIFKNSAGPHWRTRFLELDCQRRLEQAVNQSQGLNSFFAFFLGE
ncbi:hypothetical protein Pan54_46640 [Rubinisphaera italica]|uniref:Uncharacterized protein n=1 Tax=Rubinisphaera italica TaxID=2527969 RepID=A0A5C5XPC3_9PLAN|nr:hypothetical protein Pan54_46640 [Rubinisphaera italica]